MDNYELNVKQLYSSSASMIANLFFKGQITETEMSFLLSLLDSFFCQQPDLELVGALKNWFAKARDDESMAIVKNTLININLKEKEDIKKIINLINELS